MVQYDVAVIGAGIVGCAIARELSMYNLSILQLEKGNDVSLGASKANSGIVHGGYDARHGTLKSRLSYAGNQQFARWEEELQFGFEVKGALVLAFTQHELLALERLKSNGEANGVPGLRIIDRDEVIRLEPGVNPDVYAALHAPHVGVCSPYELTIALAENAVNNGVDMRLMSEVTRLQKNADGFTISTSEGRTYHAHRVVNAAGVSAGAVAAMLGIDDIMIIPRKGQYLLFRKGTGDSVNQVLFQVPSTLGKGILVTSTFHGNLMIGPNAQEVETGDDLDTDQKVLNHIFTTAQRSYPGCAAREVIRSFSGVRATSTTHDFIIRSEASIPGCIQVAGIDSPGLTAAPAIADMVIELLQEDGLECAPSDTAIRHRSRIIDRVRWHEMLPMQKANSLTKLPEGDPERVVCRCEQVREKTIRDALHRGIKVVSTDGVKRRTRAGMGMCQGKFCQPKVTRLIAEEYGLNERDVSQRGPGSGVDPQRIQRSQLQESPQE